MKLALHLLRRHLLLYAVFWSILFLVLGVLIASLLLIAPWIRELDRPSTWQLGYQLAPLIFLFVMGIMLSSAHLPVYIAHGVTRRDFLAAAGIFSMASAVLFGLVGLLGYAVEALVYQQTGILEQLRNPYPTPTAAGFGLRILAYLAFMASGFLIGLAFYRLHPWKAISVTPLAALPMLGAVFQPFEAPWLVSLALVAGAALVAFPATIGTAVRPLKA